MRVLEESLRVLATEHHELEESIASHVSSNGSSIYNTPANSYVSLPRPRRFFDAVSDDEFFDAFSQGSLFCICFFSLIGHYIDVILIFFTKYLSHSNFFIRRILGIFFLVKIIMSSNSDIQIVENNLLSFADDDGSGGTLVSLPSPCGSECSTNTLVSCMSSLPTDPQSPQSPSHLLSNISAQPGAQVSNMNTTNEEGGGTYSISQDVYTVTSTGHIIESGGTYIVSQSACHSENANGTHTTSLGLSGLVNTVSEMFAGSVHTSSGEWHSSSVNIGDKGPQNSSSTRSHTSHVSSIALETPLIRTSDLSEHSDGSDETVTSDSHHGSEVEEK